MYFPERKEEDRDCLGLSCRGIILEEEIQRKSKERIRNADRAPFVSFAQFESMKRGDEEVWGSLFNLVSGTRQELGDKEETNTKTSF